MGFSTGGKALMRWWTLLSVVVVVVAATVDNQPTDGYLHSGYFWPKTILWRGIRHPPGIYWFVFFFYVGGACNTVNGALLSFLAIFAKQQNILGDDFEEKFGDSCKIFFTSVTSLMGPGLLYISVAATNLSDVVQAYFIGMCIIQVIVDALRSIINSSPEQSDVVSYTITWCTIASFQLSAAFGIALLDSYRPLNQLNCAYSFIGTIINVLITNASVYKTKRSKVAGFIGASLQMLFCGLSYRIANQVAGVNKKQTSAFLYTAIVNYVAVTGFQILGACSEISDTRV